MFTFLGGKNLQDRDSPTCFFFSSNKCKIYLEISWENNSPRHLVVTKKRSCLKTPAANLVTFFGAFWNPPSHPKAGFTSIATTSTVANSMTSMTSTRHGVPTFQVKICQLDAGFGQQLGISTSYGSSTFFLSAGLSNSEMFPKDLLMFPEESIVVMIQQKAWRIFTKGLIPGSCVHYKSVQCVHYKSM